MAKGITMHENVLCSAFLVYFNIDATYIVQTRSPEILAFGFTIIHSIVLATDLLFACF